MYNKNIKSDVCMSNCGKEEFSTTDPQRDIKTSSKTAEKIPPLGILTKSQSTPENTGFAEIAKSRAETYALQNHAAELLPTERVRYCLKHRICKDKDVSVKYNQVRKKAHYDNLQRCGSVWTCPVCAKQISEGRREELKQGLAECRDNWGAVYMLTLTNRHHVGDNLDMLLSGQRKALNYLWGDRKPKEMFKTLGLMGRITATEVTHGRNGWHPHFHILLFFKQPLANPKSLEGFVASVWQNCCKKAGLAIPSIKHGCTIQDGTYAEQYVSKWGLEHEMTKGHTKKGNDEGRTPFDLLRDSAKGCERSGRLFQQFARAFKGKRQLSWSKGLKDLLLVEDKTDDELATETDKNSEDVRDLSYEIWGLIKRYKVRAKFLECIEYDWRLGTKTADTLIMSIAKRYTQDYMHELMKKQDINKVRADCRELMLE